MVAAQSAAETASAIWLLLNRRFIEGLPGGLNRVGSYFTEALLSFRDDGARAPLRIYSSAYAGGHRTLSHAFCARAGRPWPRAGGGIGCALQSHDRAGEQVLRQ